jgi:hypothetical protein
MLHLKNGIIDRPTTIKKNPQASAIWERMHKTVGKISHDMIRAHVIIDSALATTSYCCRVAIRVSPGALVFHRDMVLNIPIVADLQVIKDHRQNLIDETLRRNNLKRYSYDYIPGQQILLFVPDHTKLGSRTNAPFSITQVHVNGTFTFQRTPHVSVTVVVPATSHISGAAFGQNLAFSHLLRSSSSIGWPFATCLLR